MGNLKRFNLHKMMKTLDLTHVIYAKGYQEQDIEWIVQNNVEKIFFSDVLCNSYSEEEIIRKNVNSSLLDVYPVKILEYLGTNENYLVFLDAYNSRLIEDGQTVMAKLFSFKNIIHVLFSNANINKSVIIINNAKYFNQIFQTGICSENYVCSQDNDIVESLLAFQKKHNMRISTLPHDNGYILIYPDIFEFNSDYITIRASDQFALKPLLAGIPGGTCVSISRRLRDSRFATAYLKGNCIDVGGGNDSIQGYKDFFPLLKNVIVYDKEQGDAQYLGNVPDNEFNCLFSSHCLEHLYDPKEALKNWVRVVKPEGFLVIAVPDEDLYERGHWPSRFNGDHKWSFTISKHKSWCKDSINVIQLLQHFSDQVKIHKIELQDAGFHYNLGPDIDQTRLATAECAIEIILQKN